MTTLDPAFVRKFVDRAFTNHKFDALSKEELDRTYPQFSRLGDGLWIGSQSWLAGALTEHMLNYPGPTVSEVDESISDNLDLSWMRPPLRRWCVKLSAILVDNAMASFFICKLSDGRFAAFGSRINGHRWGPGVDR